MKSFRIPKLTLLYFATENVTSPSILSKLVKHELYYIYIMYKKNKKNYLKSNLIVIESLPVIILANHIFVSNFSSADVSVVSAAKDID